MLKKFQKLGLFLGLFCATGIVFANKPSCLAMKSVANTEKKDEVKREVSFGEFKRKMEEIDINELFIEETDFMLEEVKFLEREYRDSITELSKRLKYAAGANSKKSVNTYHFNIQYDLINVLKIKATLDDVSQIQQELEVFKKALEIIVGWKKTLEEARQKNLG